MSMEIIFAIVAVLLGLNLAVVGLILVQYASAKRRYTNGFTRGVPAPMPVAPGR